MHFKFLSMQGLSSWKKAAGSALRVLVYAGIALFAYFVAAEIDYWKLNQVSTEQWEKDGDVLAQIPSVRDLAHRGLEPATLHLGADSTRAKAFVYSRDALLLLIAILMAWPVFKSPRHGWRFLAELLFVLALRCAVLPLVWLPMPRNALPYYYGPVRTKTGYFFSGHTSSAFVMAWGITRYFKKALLTIAAWLIFAFIAVAQLISRAHYFPDVFTGTVVALAVCEAAMLLEWRFFPERAAPPEDDFAPGYPSV